MGARVLIATLTVLGASHSGSAQLKQKPPEPPTERKLDQKAVPPDLADWTPRPATGKVEPWEKATDKDWVDGRFRLMDTGPFLNATYRYPVGKKQETVYKGTAVRLGEGGEAGVLFDRNTLRLACGWTGGFLRHSDRRFGLLNTPVPAGEMVFASAAGPGWVLGEDATAAVAGAKTIPLPPDQARFGGITIQGNRVMFTYTVGDRLIYDTVHLSATQDGRGAFVRSAVVQPGKKAVTWLDDRPGESSIVFPASSVPLTGVRNYGNACQLDDPLHLPARPGPSRWGKPIVTKLSPGDESGPFAVDTLTIPYDNPHRALFFCTGVDFLPDGHVAVCTAHGDVWLVRVDESRAECHWQRYATGLYHPLGLKVVDGRVVVLERGQLTRLHDENNDGEADFYENINNDWHCAGGEHSYDTCLETDPDGNFYFFKTGDTHTPHGGCLMRVTKDGRKCEVVATGFRHPIGLGISPTGIITGADQEGNWMPAMRIDQYREGGFYGDMRAHHRKVPPKTYDGPLCWLPREVDNSAGGQVWVPGKTFGPLAGLPLHLSYGRCKAFVLLRDEYDGGVQGGVWDLGLTFLSGVCRGRFDPGGNLYVCGLNGWQTAAKADGCLQRVRATGKPLDVPVRMKIVPDGLELTFGRPLDRAAAEDPAHYRAAWWNYRWSGDYGSKRYRVSDPDEVGQDDVAVTRANLLEDGRTVRVSTAGGMRPVMQMQLGMNLKASDGKPVVGSVFLTVHRTGK